MELDLMVLALAGLIVWQAKPVKGWNEDYLSVAGTKPWRGLFAMMVVFHHLSLRFTGGYLFPVFFNAGFLAVAGFFFFSGYGLQKKYMTDPDYRKHFLLLRIPTVLIPYILMTLIYWLAHGLCGRVYSLGDIFTAIYRGDPIVSYSWYILHLLVFYLVFYLLMAACRKKYNLMILGGFLFYLVWTALCMVRSFGNWWYNATQLLAIGMLWAVYEKQLLAGLRRCLSVLMPLVILLFLGIYLLRPQVMEILVRLHVPANTLLLEFATTCLFVLACLLIMGKVRLGNPVLTFLGEISLEIYLTQGLVFMALDKLTIGSGLLYSLLFLAGNMVLAWALHSLFRRILGAYRRWALSR